jgi:very-short-patch-repair endonuclease
MTDDQPSDREVLRQRSKKLRDNPTPAEALLWSALRNRQLDGHRFRRKYRMLPFLFDFYCIPLKLAIELDGSSPSLSKEQDEFRVSYLEKIGIRILQFTDKQVLQDLDGVVGKIIASCKS